MAGAREVGVAGDVEAVAMELYSAIRFIQARSAPAEKLLPADAKTITRMSSRPAIAVNAE